MQISSKFRTGALYAAASTIALSAGALLVPLSASAQDKTNNSSAVSEVIVTAQKRSENLQTVPVAITAFTSKERDRAGIVSAQDQMNFTPGVTYDPQSDHLDIRGVGKVTTYIGTDPGVAVYQDGFYVASAGQINQTTLESERTEVLRGPQGTLYGRNSIGGAVNSISRQPDDEYNGEIRATWNDYVGETVEARVSGPVTDWLKLSAYFQQNDQEHGYFSYVAPHTAGPAASQAATSTSPALPAFPAATCSSLNFASAQPLTCNDFKGMGDTGGVGHGWVAHFQASYNFGSNFDGDIGIRLWKQFSRPNTAGITTPWDPIALTVPSVFYGFQGIQQPGLYNPRANTDTFADSDNYDAKQFITHDTWHGPGFDVKFIGGFWRYTTDFWQDGDAVPDAPSGVYEPTLGALAFWPGNTYPLPTVNPKDPNGTVLDPNQLNNGFDQQFQSWSTELNIASTTKGPFQWLAGAYYYNEQSEVESGYQNLDTPVYDNVTDYLFNKPQAGTGNLGCFPTINYATSTNEAYSSGGGCYTNYTNASIAAHDADPTNPANALVLAGTTGAPLPGSSALNTGSVAQLLGGYYGLTPSTVNNDPGGKLNQVTNSIRSHSFGHDNIGDNCLYCTDANLATQSEALFAQIDWKPNDQWHFTLGARYSWDQKEGYEQEIDVFWIPLVATQAEAQALGFPQYPANWPDPTKANQYVTDYVGTSCSAPGTNGIVAYDPTSNTGALVGKTTISPTTHLPIPVIDPVTGMQETVGTTVPNTTCPGHRNLKDQWQAPTGTAGVEWTPNTDTNVYVRYNRGYKSGGFNLGALVAGSGEVGPEYIDDFEGGWKQQIGHTFSFDVAAFYYLYHGLQANNATIQNSSPPIVINELINIDKSHAWGVELEAKWSPIENLLVLLNYSYLSTTNDTACTVHGTDPTAPGFSETNCFIDSANPLGASSVNGQALTGVSPKGPVIAGNQPQSLLGNTLPYSPAHKISANVSYTFKFEPGDLTLSAVENFHTSFYDNLFSTQEWLVPDGATTDFRVTWASHSGKYQVIGTVSNAFNANVLTAYSTLPPSNAYYAYNNLENPRIFSVELRYKF